MNLGFQKPVPSVALDHVYKFSDFFQKNGMYLQENYVPAEYLNSSDRFYFKKLCYTHSL